MSDFFQAAVFVYAAGVFLAALMFGLGSFDDVKVGREGRFILVILAALVWPLVVVVLAVGAVVFVGRGVVQVWRLAFPAAPKLPKATARRNKEAA